MRESGLTERDDDEEEVDEVSGRKTANVFFFTLDGSSCCGDAMVESQRRIVVSLVEDSLCKKERRREREREKSERK